MVFKRPVTSIERLYLTGKHVFSDVVIQVIIEGEGSIDSDDLGNALAKVNNQLPGTRLRLNKNCWTGDGEPTQVINLTEYPDTREHLTRFVNMHGSFQPELGHTVEVELAKKDNRTVVIFRAIHGVMDARGMEFWIQAVFAALRNEDIPRVDSTMTDDALLRKMRAPVRKDEPFIPRSTGPVCTADADTAGNFTFEYARLTLKKSIPAIVPKLGTGIQKLLMNNEGDRGTIMVPVDMRQDIPGDDSRSTANLSFPIFLPLKKGQTWSELLNLMLSKLQGRKYLARSRNNIIYRLLPLSMFVPVVRGLWKSQIKKGKYLVSAVVSHVGRHNFRDYSCADFRADSILFVPCIMPIAPLSLAVTESDTTTDIVLVQGKTLFDGPRETLNKIITLAELDHLVIRDYSTIPASSPEQPLIHAYQPQPPVIFNEAHLGFHELFERNIAANAEKPCLVYDDDVLTYSDVNARANRLAHLLLSLGLKKGDFAGVMLERSFDGIISILAIMKAGGVYVPLDPTLPENRLEYLIADSKPGFIIAMSMQTIPYSDGVKIIHIDKLQEEIEKHSDRNPNLPVYPGDLCYMIYTSGSTGQPKGAMNTHAALTNNFLWMQSTFGLSADDATLQKTPFNFDASILETFLALQCGAKIVIARPEGHKDTSYLLEEIRKHKVTFIFSVPSVLNIMLDEIEEQKNTNLRLILVGGEQFSMHLYEKFRSRFPEVSVYNLYGPAEAAIEVTTFDCRQEFNGESVPIGKPIANIETFVVDDNMNPVEQGASGELIIYGIGIGSGYFGKEELTAEKFIDHPFIKNSEHKAYRTGDIVRQLPDGNLVFLGRKDNQIKIGGVRIETGEIEYHLQSIPWIDQAIVAGKTVSSKQSDSQITLVAYYSASESDESDQSKYIRTYLRDRLPGYMVPSVIIRIDSFPLNPSGKVDRLNLPDPEAWITGEAESRDSWSDIEKQLADIWASVLCTPPDRNCNFFDMGGNSILAITLIEKINKHFQCSLHAKMIYENPDFSDIVKILQSL